MYEGSSFAQSYESRCSEQEQRRVRAWKIFYIVVIVVGLASLVVLLSGGIFIEQIFAASKDNDAASALSLEDAALQSSLPEEHISESGFREEEFVENSQDKQLKNMDTLPEAAQKEQRKPIVFVDAGHGGADGGCSVGKVTEKDINLAIAKIVQDKLETLGYDVVMSREEDIFVTKEERVIAANECEADIYISIHQNFSEDKRVNGMEVWYQGEDTQRDNLRLAQLVQQQTVKYTGALERELRGNAEFHVTGETTMPACLIEVGFLSNSKERGKLVSDTYQEQVADGIVQGIEDYFHSKVISLMFETIKCTQRSWEYIKNIPSML